MSTRSILTALALSIVAGLSACGGGEGGIGGGGGGGGPALVADFSYSGVGLLLRQSTMDIQVSGLTGSTLSCSVVAGSLPPGLNLTEGCRISGIPTAVGVSFATIRLAASGFSGSVDKQVRLEVLGPELLYRLPMSASRGTPISAFPDDVSQDPARLWTPGPGVTTVYSVASGTLPTGLTLEPATGQVHGILTETAIRTFTISVALSSPQGSLTITGQNHYTINTVLEGLQFFYGPGDFPVTVSAGTAIDMRPLFNFGFNLDPSKYTFGSFRLAADSPALPSGLVLDPVTGHISGTAAVAGTYHMVFEVDLNSAGQMAPYRSSVLDLTITS